MDKHNVVVVVPMLLLPNLAGPEVSMDKHNKNLAGVEHREWHNLYGMYMQQATAEGLLQRNEPQDKRPFVLSRSFYSGSQRCAGRPPGGNRRRHRRRRPPPPPSRRRRRRPPPPPPHAPSPLHPRWQVGRHPDRRQRLRPHPSTPPYYPTMAGGAPSGRATTPASGTTSRRRCPCYSRSASVGSPSQVRSRDACMHACRSRELTLCGITFSGAVT